MLKRLNKITPVSNKRCTIIQPVISIDTVAAQSNLQITRIIWCQPIDESNLPSGYTASRRRTVFFGATWRSRSTGCYPHFLALRFIRNVLVQCLGDTVTIIVSISNAGQFECLANDGWMCRSHLFAGYHIREASHYVSARGFLGAWSKAHAQKLHEKDEVQGELSIEMTSWLLNTFVMPFWFTSGGLDCADSIGVAILQAGYTGCLPAYSAFAENPELLGIVSSARSSHSLTIPRKTTTFMLISIFMQFCWAQQNRCPFTFTQVRIGRTLSYMLYMIHITACTYYAYSDYQGRLCHKFLPTLRLKFRSIETNSIWPS